MGRGSSDPHQKALAAQRDAHKEQHWRSGMTWPPDFPFALVLQRAQQKDQQALSALYKRFLPVVYRFVLARVSDQHLAEDLTADTFFAVVKDIGATRANDELGFSAWVLGIARSRVLQHFRRQHTYVWRPNAIWRPWRSRFTSDDEDDPPGDYHCTGELGHDCCGAQSPDRRPTICGALPLRPRLFGGGGGGSPR